MLGEGPPHPQQEGGADTTYLITRDNGLITIHIEDANIEISYVLEDISPTARGI